MTRLLEMLASEKVSEVHGYYLAITGLSKIGKAKVRDVQALVFQGPERRDL